MSGIQESALTTGQLSALQAFMQEQKIDPKVLVRSVLGDLAKEKNITSQFIREMDEIMLRGMPDDEEEAKAAMQNEDLDSEESQGTDAAEILKKLGADRKIDLPDITAVEEEAKTAASFVAKVKRSCAQFKLTGKERVEICDIELAVEFYETFALLDAKKRQAIAERTRKLLEAGSQGKENAKDLIEQEDKIIAEQNTAIEALKGNRKYKALTINFIGIAGHSLLRWLNYLRPILSRAKGKKSWWSTPAWALHLIDELPPLMAICEGEVEKWTEAVATQRAKNLEQTLDSAQRVAENVSQAYQTGYQIASAAVSQLPSKRSSRAPSRGGADVSEHARISTAIVKVKTLSASELKQIQNYLPTIFSAKTLIVLNELAAALGVPRENLPFPRLSLAQMSTTSTMHFQPADTEAERLTNAQERALVTQVIENLILEDGAKTVAVQKCIQSLNQKENQSFEFKNLYQRLAGYEKESSINATAALAVPGFLTVEEIKALEADKSADIEKFNAYYNKCKFLTNLTSKTAARFLPEYPEGTALSNSLKSLMSACQSHPIKKAVKSSVV